MQSASAQVESDAGAGGQLVDLVCPVHGDYVARRALAYVNYAALIDCPKCINAKEFESGREAREKASKVLRERTMDRLGKLAKIPPRFAGKTFDDFHVFNPGQRAAQVVCRQYATNWRSQLVKGGGLVLTGNTGTGKTLLACTIANTIMREESAPVVFGTVSSVIRSVRATYGKNSTRTESEAIDDLLTPDLLIIDEIGASSGSDHELGLLFEIINKRYENLRPMIVISNLNVDDLRKFLGQRAMDRFTECGAVLAFDWESHRGKMQA